MRKIRGREYGTAAEIAARLGPDVTEAMVHNWRQRDGLERYRVGRTVYSPVDQAATICLAKEKTGKGRPRRLDATLVNAA